MFSRWGDDPGGARERKLGVVGIGEPTATARGRQSLPAPFDSGGRDNRGEPGGYSAALRNRNTRGVTCAV